MSWPPVHTVKSRCTKETRWGRTDTNPCICVGFGTMFLGDSASNEAQPAQPVVKAAWYCARTKPKHEHIASANLQRHAGLEVFCPRLRVEKSTRRGIVRVSEPLFPNYIF